MQRNRFNLIGTGLINIPVYKSDGTYVWQLISIESIIRIMPIEGGSMIATKIGSVDSKSFNPIIKTSISPQGIALAAKFVSDRITYSEFTDRDGDELTIAIEI